MQPTPLSPNMDQNGYISFWIVEGKWSAPTFDRFGVAHQLNLRLHFYCCVWTYNLQMLSSKQTAPPSEQPLTKGLKSIKSLGNLRCCSNAAPSPLGSPRAFQKYEVILDGENTQDELRVIEWRCRTEFPIVKVLFYRSLPRKTVNQCPVVQVAIENFPASLHSLPRMPLFQAFYLMKEALIGFERLFDRFGTFDVSGKMVLLNKNMRCRVWMNENVTLNFPARRARITQPQFKNQILKLFQEKCIKSTLAAEFFRSAVGVPSMLETIQFIESFAKTHRIILAHKFTSIYESLGNKKQEEGPNEGRFQTSSMKKIPKFIQDLRALRRTQNAVTNKSFDSCVKEGVPRGLSHKKPANKEMKQSDVESTSKSILTPKSFTSVDAKQYSIHEETTSNTPHKRIAKQQSLQNFKLTSLSNISRKEPLKTQKPMGKEEDTMSHPINLNQNPRFQLTKVHKFRKLSNGEPAEKPQQTLHVPFSSNTLQVPASQPPRRKGEVSLKSILDSVQGKSPLPLPQGETVDVFQKNGWLKRFNSLTAEQFRDTIHSHFDGNDVLCDELRLSNLNLDILGAMGKQLRGSILVQQER